MGDDTKLYECKHCSGTGTCKTANGNSCGKCIQDAQYKNIFFYFINHRKAVGEIGLVCSVCDGIGACQIKTDKINKRAQFRLALWIIIPVLSITWYMAFRESTYFPEFLTFSGTLIGGITGFYFGRRANDAE